MATDKILTCSDCGQEFTFTASEQDFYAERGFTEPRRCASCRASRKAARNAEGGGSGSYSSGGLQLRRRSYSSGGGGGYGSRGPREMFPATCSSCGQETEVPFKPTSGKPVYCSACFAQRRACDHGRGTATPDRAAPAAAAERARPPQARDRRLPARELQVTCVCGWVGSSQSPDGRPSSWSRHVADAKQEGR